MINATLSRLIILYGASCSGKTTIGKNIAETLPETAFISLDSLRKIIKNGLVSSFNFSLSDEADETKKAQYERFKKHRLITLENALLLADNFTKQRINVVMEGLETDCMPGTEKFVQMFRPYNTFTVHVDCEEDIIQNRWIERRCKRYTYDYLDAFRKNSDSFSCSVDSSRTSAESNAKHILNQLK